MVAMIQGGEGVHRAAKGRALLQRETHPGRASAGTLAAAFLGGGKGDRLGLPSVLPLRASKSRLLGCRLLPRTVKRGGVVVYGGAGLLCRGGAFVVTFHEAVSPQQLPAATRDHVAYRDHVILYCHKYCYFLLPARLQGCPLS
jgi:hypothetical protein